MGAIFFPINSEQPDSPLVAKVVPNTPAAQAGIRDGDILLKIDHYPIAYWREDGTLLRRMGGRVPAGTKILYTVRRGEAELDLTATARDILH